MVWKIGHIGQTFQTKVWFVKTMLLVLQPRPQARMAAAQPTKHHNNEKTAVWIFEKVRNKHFTRLTSSNAKQSVTTAQKGLAASFYSVPVHCARLRQSKELKNGRLSCSVWCEFCNMYCSIFTCYSFVLMNIPCLTRRVITVCSLLQLDGEVKKTNRTADVALRNCQVSDLSCFWPF